MDKTIGGDICSVIGAGGGIRIGQGQGQDKFRNDTLRQCIRVERKCYSLLQGADGERGAYDSDSSGDYEILYDHSRGVPPSDGGGDDFGRQRDIRLRHGRVGDVSSFGGTDNRVVGLPCGKRQYWLATG